MNNPVITHEEYWSVLHSFLHKPKIPKIAPIRHNKTFFNWYLGKSEYLQLFFRKAMFLNWDNQWGTCALSADPPSLRISKSWSSILSIICAFDVSKTHVWNDVSVRMVKIFDESLVKLLFIIFQFSLETGNFPSNWKRSNMIPLDKKGNKDLISNHRPVSLLSIFCRIYEKCIYDTLYN